jgi:Cdc6-like AAA superfamily ATPase
MKNDELERLEEWYKKNRTEINETIPEADRASVLRELKKAYKTEKRRIMEYKSIETVGETPDATDDAKEYSAGFEQWLVDGDKFIPITRTIPELPAGDYGIKYDRTYDKYVLVLRQPLSEELIHLPMKEFDEVLEDIKTFWSSRDAYDEYGYIYKRGILLYGPPGCGKSSLVMLMNKELINKYDGIVINVSTSDDIVVFDDIMKGVREIEPDRPVITVIEDIDNFVNSERGPNELVSKLLNILDGKMQYDNMVIIATTNYPELLEERISNRPTRFDLRREIGAPKMKAREFYLRSKLKQKDIKKIDMEEWLSKTQGFTIDHLKELVCLVFVHKHPFEKALAEVRGMVSEPRLRNKSKSATDKVGFGNKHAEPDDDRPAPSPYGAEQQKIRER